MADNQPTTPVEEKAYDYVKDHDKSWDQIAYDIGQHSKQQAGEIRDENPEIVSKVDTPADKQEQKREEPAKETKTESSIVPTPPPVDPVKIAEDAAKKAVEEYKTELERIQSSKSLLEEEKIKRENALKA